MRVGIDIGGTFTDVILFDAETGQIVRTYKVLSTPRNPERAVISILSKIQQMKVNMVIHATTIATNALLGQIGLELPRVALITTKGFRDIIEIGRQKRPTLYDLFFDKPKPLVPRNLRFEVDERINYRGEILKPLNPNEVREIVQKIKQLKIISIAVSLLHSYANPKHEQIIGKIIREMYPKAMISLSSEVCPEHREYERTSTTVINAILMPIISNYLSKLSKTIKDIFRIATFLIMQSSGGLSSAEEVCKLPISIIESGPSAGVIATAWLSKLLGINKAISFDMGGTTAKAGTVINFSPLFTTEYEVGGKAHFGRIIKGSGYPVRFSFIDLSEVSAGGGTIIWIDEGGALRVGPIGAGADPGPACYGKKGPATITDANVLLGRLGEYLLGGEMKIYPELSQQEFKKLANEIGMDIIDIALGAIKIVNTIMARCLRLVTIERGLDPREFSLVAFGGAGPMHACFLAKELGIRRVIIPPVPGLFSALGLLVTDVKHVFVKSVRNLLDDIDPNELENIFLTLENKGFHILKKEGFSSDKIIMKRFVDVRYWLQGYELIIPVVSPITEVELRNIAQRFHEKHKSTYGFIMEDEPIEIVNVRVEAYGLLPKPKLVKIKQGKREPKQDAIVGNRKVIFEDSEEEVKIFKREKLLAYNEIEGPAIIEEYSATIVIPQNWIAKVDEYGSIILEVM